MIAVGERGSALLQLVDPIGKRFNFGMQRADRCGVSSLPHLLRRSPFMKFGQQVGFDSFQLLAEPLPLQLQLFSDLFLHPVLVFVG